MEQPKSDPQGDLFDVNTESVDADPQADVFDVKTVQLDADGNQRPPDIFDVNTVQLDAAGNQQPPDIFDVNTVQLDAAGNQRPPDIFDVNTVQLDAAGPQPDGIFDLNTAHLDSYDGAATRVEGGPAPVAPPQVGTQFGEYLLESKLGTGGQGAVYVGVHLQLGVRHAVKVVYMEDATLVERFAREARSLAALDGHPGIVRVFNCGAVGSWGYIACDLVEGIDLHRAVAQGAFPPHEAARVVAGIARALAHAHAAGIVHRDLKPANVLLSGPGFEPLLTDFGLAHVEADIRLTAAGKVVGTPTYMAPEQVRREPIGPPADVFCLGIVLHEMLTGRKLFHWRSLPEAAATIGEPVAAPSSLKPEVPPELDSLVLWMLATAPEDRPSAATIGLHLSAFCGGEAVETEVAPPPRGIPRKPLIGAAAFLLAGLLLFVGLQVHRSSRLSSVQDAPEFQRAARLRDATSAATAEERIEGLRALLDAHPDDPEAAVALEALVDAKRHADLVACWVEDPQQRVERLERYVEEHPQDELGVSLLERARAEWKQARLAAALTSLNPQTRRELLQAYAKEFPGDPDGLAALEEVAPWQKRKTKEEPGRRYRFAWAYDEAREVTVLFGGAGSDYKPLGETWTWNGEAWTQQETELEPPKRKAHCMAYDQARRTVLLFGGEGEEDELHESTWEWDGSKWRDRGAEGAPEPRAYAGMAYDSERKVVVLFGGETEKGNRNDTWVWHGDHWTELDPPTRPARRRDHVLVYDPIQKRILLLGGRGKGDTLMSDVWALTGATWRRLDWSLPVPLRGHRVAFDPSRRGLILFGGRSQGAKYADATWLREETRWRRLYTSRSPAGLYGHGLAYDQARAEVVLFGGRTVRSRSRRDETWTYAASKR